MGKHAPSYHEPAYADVPAKYQYEYAGVNFGANEARDGYSTYGEYSVVLPDCRTQRVKYNTADGYSGNIVEVTYSGEPCYDTYKPVHNAPLITPQPLRTNQLHHTNQLPIKANFVIKQQIAVLYCDIYFYLFICK